MNKDQTIFIIMLASILCLGIYGGFVSGKSESCPVAEVYMIGNVQEDDLFIPASSIGKVDLKR